MRQRLIALACGIAFCAVSTGAQSPRHFMWKVENEAGAIAYLLGSIHVLTEDAYPLPEAVNAAFAGSKVLVEELDIDQADDPAQMTSALAKAMLTNGRTLEQVIAPQLFADVKQRAEQAGLPMAVLQRMKPWLVAVTIMIPTLQGSGLKPELGVDRHFFDRAKSLGMKRQALETLAFQLDRFDQLSPPLQEQLLKTTLADLDTEVKSVREIVAAWKSGNVAAIEKLTLTQLQEFPELYQRLLVERNHNWVPHVETCLEQRAGCFVVVGAAHLVGPDGLPALLAKKGFKVTQQ